MKTLRESPVRKRRRPKGTPCEGEAWTGVSHESSTSAVTVATAALPGLFIMTGYFHFIIMSVILLYSTTYKSVFSLR